MKKIALVTAGIALAATSVASVAQSTGSVAASAATATQAAGSTASSDVLPVQTPAGAAKALSVKQSALYPRRAPAKGERQAGGGNVALILVVVAGVVGGIGLIASSGGDSR